MGSELLNKTLELLDNRPSPLTYKTIETETGLTETWLKSLAARKSKGPSVVKIEMLYKYLSGKALSL